ncbi:hypothetical protein BD413DRAFT_242567 [Trametes elegans]|nr:hypothetical protein BD413DRAFT_242567 [Trametes elegans]
MESLPPPTFASGSLYIAGFTQARAPHVALLIPKDARIGDLVHIRIDRATSPTWQYQHRAQKISGDMFLSSLLKIHDNSEGQITVDQLKAAASVVPAPNNDTFGECGPWVLKVVEYLDKEGLLTLKNAAALVDEFNTLATSSRGFARRDRFPNVAVSENCV